MPGSDDELLSIKPAAELLEVPVVTLYRWLDRGAVEEATNTGPDGEHLGARKVSRTVIEQMRRDGDLPFARPADQTKWRQRTRWRPANTPRSAREGES